MRCRSRSAALQSWRRAAGSARVLGPGSLIALASPHQGLLRPASHERRTPDSFQRQAGRLGTPPRFLLPASAGHGASSRDPFDEAEGKLCHAYVDPGKGRRLCTAGGAAYQPASVAAAPGGSRDLLRLPLSLDRSIRQGHGGGAAAVAQDRWGTPRAGHTGARDPSPAGARGGGHAGSGGAAQQGPSGGGGGSRQSRAPGESFWGRRRGQQRAGLDAPIPGPGSCYGCCGPRHPHAGGCCWGRSSAWAEEGQADRGSGPGSPAQAYAADGHPWQASAALLAGHVLRLITSLSAAAFEALDAEMELLAKVTLDSREGEGQGQPEVLPTGRSIWDF